MSRQITKINYAEKTVEDGGILYDMEDLARLSSIYERLCTAEYLFDTDERIETMAFAYAVADYIRDEVENTCECEGEVISFYLDDAIAKAQEDFYTSDMEDK